MSGTEPDHHVRVPLNLQRWADITFLHWRYEPAALEPFIPAGLRLQLHDGTAWLGLTPFTLADLRLPGLPAVPRWSTFPELNLRTYVTDGRHDGVLFLRIHCARRSVTLGLRAGLGLPYVYRSGHVELTGATVRYAIGNTRAEVTVGARIGASPLAGRLTGRWNAYSRHLGTLLRVPISHPPWPLHDARLLSLHTDLWNATGLPEPQDEPWVHHSPGVPVRIGAPRRVRSTATEP
ncbi:DUF2071 domain-containing protein [Xylanimonas oleitrophica]|uniref:DUF2071 domain-containing protein n=1 Tax=Xylanimonas oleitrophica TaxID=2607479 RepID=A0A2W5WLJ5_9MICO|nr:DUF2071 domain-containing protein [Xylanimonas oleitrophica]PZR52187.1 DUF2071 domain-containing protein [Xylanimonas oleitrophica]